MIFSSYYGNVNKLIEFGVPKESFVSVSLKVPDLGFKIVSEENVKPWEYCFWDYKFGFMDWKEYCLKYYEKLRYLNDDFWKIFLKKYSGCVLLCYEKNVKNCHRMLLGKYLDWKFGKGKIVEVDSNLDCWEIKNVENLVYKGNVGRKHRIINV